MIKHRGEDREIDLGGTAERLLTLYGVTYEVVRGILAIERKVPFEEIPSEDIVYVLKEMEKIANGDRATP